MKYLESSDIDFLTLCLSFETSDCKVSGRVESYSCKSISGDKKYQKHMEKIFAERFEEEKSLSPEFRFYSASTSPFGPLSNHNSRKAFYSLVLTLNSSYPEYDFSNLKPHQFIRVPHLSLTVNSINHVMSSVGALNRINHSNFWGVLDAHIHLAESEIYSYIPDNDSDPFAEEGCIWSFNYFFFNRKLKKVVFLTCRSVSLKTIIEEDADARIFDGMSDSFEYGMEYDDYVMANADL